MNLSSLLARCLYLFVLSIMNNTRLLNSYPFCFSLVLLSLFSLRYPRHVKLFTEKRRSLVVREKKAIFVLKFFSFVVSTKKYRAFKWHGMGFMCVWDARGKCVARQRVCQKTEIYSLWLRYRKISYIKSWSFFILFHYNFYYLHHRVLNFYILFFISISFMCFKKDLSSSFFL